MKESLKNRLINIAKIHTDKNDASHDFGHSLRVLQNVLTISQEEECDLDILIPGALFHDAIIYAKNHPKSENAPRESAILTRQILEQEKEFPQHKIDAVCSVIEECSFNKTSEPKNIETKILRDADRLEATGIIAIMRTFASTGQMGTKFYDHEDPFCDNRKPEPFKYGLDLFYERLLIAKDRVHTATAKKMAIERTKFLEIFLAELKKELILNK
jgi:uncharacterized protein